MQTDVGGNIFKLQLNPQQLMSQGCDSQAETTWREWHEAPALSACPACRQCRLHTSACPAPALPAVLLQEQLLQSGHPSLLLQPGVPAAVQGMGTCVTSVANPE